MEVQDLVSIVVPVYNVEKYLKRCIDSIINQSYNNIEILLVDDGATDSSGLICDEYEKKDSRIKTIHKKNGGLSDARNKGIDQANGKYICFVDSDDWIEKSMIYDLIKEVKKTNSDIAICGRYRSYEDRDKEIEKYQKYPEKENFDNVDGLKYLMSFCGYDMSVCDKMFLTELFKEVRFPFGKTCEDSFTTYKVFSLAKRICYLDKQLYNYYYRPNSISRNSDVNETVITAGKEQYDFINKEFPQNINEASSFLITAYMSVYNEYIKRDKKCIKIGSYKSESIKLLRKALKNKNISFTKKLQMIIFCFSSSIYKIIYKKHLKGIK